ncbi:hypothetical protein [Nostoc sphaeroides]|uniref:hypothetical protein n=1 Tax=Nostoc sphaeroides TaxID=446679 RepID=UPI003B837ECC
MSVNKILRKIAQNMVFLGRSLNYISLTVIINLFPKIVKDILKSLPKNEYIVLNSCLFFECWLSYALDNIAVLNNGLRPFMSKRHPLLQTWEAQRPPHLSLKEHERNWPDEPKLRGELESLRQDLEQYANALAVIAGVKE